MIIILYTLGLVEILCEEDLYVFMYVCTVDFTLSKR